MTRPGLRLLLGAALLATFILCSPKRLLAQDMEAKNVAKRLSRLTIPLMADWKFIRQDVPEAKDSSFDDSSWTAISLPHTWNNLDGQDGGGDYYRGVGWYRRHFDATLLSVREKSIFIRFDGASIATEVFVNGASAGAAHRGMFGAFCYDITSLIHSGDNVFAVRVDNSANKDIPPLSADFTFFGGIYRPVELLVLNPISISPLDDASPGVYLEQKNVTPTHADINAHAMLRNASKTDRNVEVTCTIYDRKNIVQQGKTTQHIAAGQGVEASIPLAIDNPHLWNGRPDPFMYSAQVRVTDQGEEVDVLDQPLGLRFFNADPDKGFFLNGASYPLHGVTRHQDRPDKGWAISDEDHVQDFNLIYEMGCNAVRLAHYEHAQTFYNLCDRNGLVVWAELCLVNEVTPEQEFSDNAKQQLRELIKQNYNHPSICFWSLFNELGDNKTAAPLKVPEQRAAQIALVTELNTLAHSLDSTRLTTAASHRDADYPLSKITDVIAFNRYFGWYTGTNADWTSKLDAIHAALPNRAVAISEYGAGASIFQHEANPAKPKTTGIWHPEEYQSIVHEQAYAALRERPWLWGTFLWNMFDFASDNRKEGDHPGINDKGLVTYDRKTKKDAFFFYKANWTTDPFVYVTDRRFTPRPSGAGGVKIYSNCDSVTLSVNHKTLGDQKSDTHVFVWPDAVLDQGSNELTATGAAQGKTVTDTITIVVDPNASARLTTTPTTAPAQ